MCLIATTPPRSETQDALEEARAVQVRAANFGMDWTHIADVIDKTQEELDELREAIASGNRSAAHDELGDLFFSAVNLARFLDASPCNALRESTKKFTNRFEKLRDVVEKSGRDWKSYSLRELDQLWDEIKVRTEQGLEEGG